MSALRTINTFTDNVVSTKLVKAKAANVFKRRHKAKKMTKSALVTFNTFRGKKQRIQQKKCPRHKQSDIVENPIIPLKHQFLSAKAERKRKFKKPTNARPPGTLPESLRQRPSRDDTTGHADDATSPPTPPPIPPPRPPRVKVKKETTSASTSTPTKSRAFVSTQTPPDKRRSEEDSAEDAETMKMALEKMRGDQRNIKELEEDMRRGKRRIKQLEGSLMVEKESSHQRSVADLRRSEKDLAIMVADQKKGYEDLALMKELIIENENLRTSALKPPSSDIGVGASTEFLNQITSTEPLPESRNAEVMANMEEMAEQQDAVQEVVSNVVDNTPQPVQTLTRGISNAAVATPGVVLRGAANVVGAVAPALFKGAIMVTKGAANVAGTVAPVLFKAVTKGFAGQKRQREDEENIRVKQVRLPSLPNLPSHNEQGSLLRSAALTAQDRNDTVEFEAAKKTFIDVYMPKWDKKVKKRGDKIDDPEMRSKYEKKAAVERAKLVAFDPKNLPKNISGRGVSLSSSTPAPPMLFKKGHCKRKKEKRGRVQNGQANKRRKI